MAPSSIKEGGGERRGEQHQAKTLSPLSNFSGGEDQGVTNPVVYQRTPLHTSMPTAEACTTGKTSISSSSASRRVYDTLEADDKTVSCNTCRPTGREKISIVPVEANGGGGGAAGDGRGQNGTNVFKSLLFSIARKSPKWGVGCDQSPMSSPSTVRSRDEQRNTAFNELTQKLVAANRRRDEALAEVARLRTSMGELERKLGKLEVYCHDLKKALDARIAEETTIGGVVVPEAAGGRHKKQGNPVAVFAPRDAEAARAVESFLQAVSDSRSSVRHLGKSLAAHLGQMGTKAFERLTALLSPYDVRISPKSSRAIVFYIEALLSRALYEDFETPAFERSAPDALLNPTERCRANLDAYTALKALSWEEVLSKGTRRFSESFSRFCDQKMSAIMGMLGWGKAWPEPLLQAFFGAAKHVWLVHLLAFAFHPSLPIFRVDKGAAFDGLYMEDIAGDKLLLKKNTTTSGGAASYAVVRIMVSPGFYVHSNVVKCKVLCRYQQQQAQQG
ncbi:unnamed protein product [Victoria cruziana]